jgi:hypothetical protein
MTDFDVTEYFSKHCFLKRKFKIVLVHTLKAYGWVGSVAPLIKLLTLALDGGECSFLHPSHFTARENVPGTH